MLKRNDNLNVIWTRLDSDDVTFAKDQFDHIDLELPNDTGLLETVADQIHAAYQAFLKE